MRHTGNEQGIALITALMFCLICLTMLMGLMYLLTQGIQVSGSQKRFKTALEASYGGAEIALKEVIPQVFQGYTSSQITSQFSGVGLQFDSSSRCLRQKLTLAPSQWDSTCSQLLNPKTSPDLQFTLQAQGSGARPYSVYAKIVDTVPGNTDTSGLQLDGSGVAEANTIIVPQHFPYIYRVEIQAERQVNATEQANLSIQYAY